jgi:hypothetical protein
MSLRLNQVAPDFTADTTEGPISFHAWLGDGWGIGLSVDPVEKHAGWAADIEETQGTAPNFPMIGDPALAVSKLYDMLPAEADGDASVIIVPAVSNEEAKTLYPDGWQQIKPDLRLVPQPGKGVWLWQRDHELSPSGRFRMGPCRDRGQATGKSVPCYATQLP